jgi:hypothetical protein
LEQVVHLLSELGNFTCFLFCRSLVHISFGQSFMTHVFAEVRVHALTAFVAAIFTESVIGATNAVKA